MNAQPILCPYCNKQCATDTGLRRHISSKPSCKEKELRGLQQKNVGHKTAFDYMEMVEGPQSSSKRRKLCDTNSQKMGKTTGPNLQNDQQTDDDSTNLGDDFHMQHGYNTDSSDDDEPDFVVNNTTPLDSILNDFEEYVENYDSIYHDFVHKEKTAIDLLGRVRATKASLDTYESMFEWHIQAIKGFNGPISLGDHPEFIGRKTIYKALYKRYNVHGKVCIPQSVTLRSSRTKYLVVKNSAEWCIQSLLTDPRITDDDYLFFNNSPYQPPPQYTNTHVGDINTGEAYFQTWAKYITKPGIQALLPVIFYLDAASTGQFVDLPITALKMTLGIFNRKFREKPYAWRTLAYLPKISDADQKKAAGKRMLFESGHVDMCMAHNDMEENEGNAAASSTLKPQDYHDLLAVALEDFVKIQERGFRWKLKYRGQLWPVEFVLYVPFIKCDTDEADVLTGKYKSRGRGVAQLCRYCYCPAKKCCDPLAQYDLKIAKDIQELIEAADEEQLRSISQQYIDNACYLLRFSADNEQGVHGGTPFEVLHGVLLGVFKYVRDIFFNNMGNKSKYYEDFQALANEYGKLFNRQSDRDMPKTTFTNGVDSGKKEAKEFVGIYLVIAAVLCSSKGKEILNRHHYYGEKYTFNAWILLIERMLMWEQWLKSDTMSKDHVHKAEKKFRYLMYLIRKTAPRKEGMGWCILKFHAICHMAADILRFGVPNNYDTEADEALHKPSKKAAGVVQKRKSKFDEQVANRLMEAHVLDLAQEEYLNKRRMVDYYWERTEEIQETPLAEEAGTIGGATYVVEKGANNLWHLKHTRSKQYIRVEADFPRFVAKLTELTSPFLPNRAVIRTEFSKNGNIFRASCKYQAGVWRDWARIDWGDDGQLPNKIWGFVDFSHIRPNNKVEIGGITGIIPGMYAIVESAVEERPKQGEYRSQLFGKLTKEVGSMEDDRVKTTKFYLADADAIIEPLVVVPDINGAANSYLMLKPRAKWATEFEKWLDKPHEKMMQLPDDSDDESEEDE